MIKFWKLRFAIESQKATDVMAGYTENPGSLAISATGYFITDQELEEVRRNAFEAGRATGSLEKARQLQKDINTVPTAFGTFENFNDYLASLEEKEK